MPAGKTESLSKPDLRRRARDVRREAYLRFGTRIGPILTANFLQRFSFAPNAAVAGYWPMNEEADIRPLLTALDRRGHAIGLPAVVRPGAPLRFLRWREGDDVVSGYHGVPEPPATAAEVLPNVMLVPLLAYDRTGARLGYGGGFYDRTIARLRAEGTVTAIGVAFSAQEVDSLPVDDHDQPLDWILTEQGVLDTGRAFRRVEPRETEPRETEEE